jgi:putative membrane protein
MDMNQSLTKTGNLMEPNDEDKTRIRNLVERLEARTGVQVMAFAAARCDAYPEIPWKAFALGAALAAFAIALDSLARPGWSAPLPLGYGVAVLGTGAVLALLAVFLAPVARLFLGRARAEMETRHFAQIQFLERGLTQTRERRALLVLVAGFERRAAIVADTGVLAQVQLSELARVAEDMSQALARGQSLGALAEGLSAVETLLAERGFTGKGGAPDEIPEEFVETEKP